ncbi:MAG: hypothetical protein WC061_04225, partial [Melioribacteraceae bacterium]
MEFGNIINLITQHKREIATAYFDQVKNSEYMKTYHKLDPQKVITREEATYSHLVEWLKSGIDNDEAEKFFSNIGSERYREGFPLSELNYALYISKKAFWAFLMEHSEIIEGLEKKNIIEFFGILSNYFALGGFYMVRGYINTLFDKLDINDRLTREEIHNILVRGAFD